ncbi:MAG: dockerin type I repeat-containing protein [Dehalococcoidia bacterium]|nr:dockerin type I repeat-containing protein [Dehalococcoidia bacterium]
MKTIIASAIGGLLFAVLGAMAALANPYVEGNPLDWCPDDNPLCAQWQGLQLALRQDRIGSLYVNGDLVQVCSPQDQFPNSTMYAVYTWHVRLTESHGYTADPNWPGLFQWWPACDGLADVWVTTDNFFNLCPEKNGRRPHACTAPDIAELDYPGHSLGFAWVALQPGLFSDDTQHTNRDIAHELGHSFGAGEYDGCPYGSTVMDRTEQGCSWVGYATALDANNYYKLYHPPAVLDAWYSFPTPTNDTIVALHWNQHQLWWDEAARAWRDMPNEKAFCVYRESGHVDCDAGSTYVDCFEKNTEGITLTAQPSGEKTYCIYSMSNADNSTTHAHAVVYDDAPPTRTPRPTHTPTKTPTITPTPKPDADGDGVLDGVDSCPNDHNPDQEDWDDDTVGDACDNCPDDYNDDQANADGDSFGDVCDVCPNDSNNDGDNDGICAGIGYWPPKTGDKDNCPNNNNPDQTNTDRVRPNGTAIPGEYASNPTSDSLGDACDDDDDADAVLDSIESSYGCGNPLAPTNPLKADTDDDRVVDGGECRLLSNPNDPNSKPTCSFGFIPDSDGDCLPLPLEMVIGSSDNNKDSDGDGIEDGLEVKGYATSPIKSDNDGDGCPDWLEIMDIDGDRSVDAGDVSLLSERVAGVIPPSDSDPIFDVNKDGYIDVGDEELMAANTCASKGYACPCSPEYESSAPVTPVAPAVGGVAELPEGELPSASTGSGSSSPPYAALAGAAAGVVALAAGGWYARRGRRET